MDDLDHSMYVAEYDWTSFYKDSEECSLPDPLLACPDTSVLSDSEDSTHASDTPAGRQCDTPAESCITVCSRKEDSDDGGHMASIEDTSTKTAGHIPEASRATSASGVTAQSFTPEQTEPRGDEPHTGEDRSKFPSRVEKERWFVTVGYCPVRPRVKKKHRPKKPCKGSHMRRPEQVQTAEGGRDSGTHKDKRQEDGERELRAPSNRSSGQHDDMTRLRSSETETGPTEETAEERRNSASTSDEDSTEFFSIPGSDSESYLSAYEPAEDPPENCTDEGGHCLADARGDQARAEPAAPFGQPASGCSLGDRVASLSLPVPRLTVTPCSAADGPETYAEVAGHTRPVCAMSAFWDEMEKLTINDILQLRMATSPPPRDGQSLADGDGCHLSDGGLMDTSDTADSDYFTQPDESKRDRSSCEFSTSDFDEEFWQVVGSSGRSSPDACSRSERSQRASTSGGEEEKGSTSSEGKTLAPPQEWGGQIERVRPRQMTKSKSVHDVRALSTDVDSSSRSSCASMEDDSGVRAGLLTSCPEVVERSTHSSLTVDDPENIPVFTAPHETTPPCLHYLRCGDERKPIPIFSCCHPTARELALLTADSSGDMSPVRVLSQASVCGWEGWRKVRVCDRGCGPRGFPREAEERATLQTLGLGEGGVSPAPRLRFGEPTAQWRVLETTQATNGERLFLSTLKQSDMCLACIALASWVLTSSDSEAADGWKAALLANVSALSAIRYLRQYVKRNPTQNDA